MMRKESVNVNTGYVLIRRGEVRVMRDTERWEALRRRRQTRPSRLRGTGTSTFASLSEGQRFPVTDSKAKVRCDTDCREIGRPDLK